MKIRKIAHITLTAVEVVIAIAAAIWCVLKFQELILSGKFCFFNSPADSCPVDKLGEPIAWVLSCFVTIAALFSITGMKILVPVAIIEKIKRSIIKEKGGKKMTCPKCNDRKQDKKEKGFWLLLLISGIAVIVFSIILNFPDYPSWCVQAFGLSLWVFLATGASLSLNDNHAKDQDGD